MRGKSSSSPFPKLPLVKSQLLSGEGPSETHPGQGAPSPTGKWGWRLGPQENKGVTAEQVTDGTVGG